MSRVTVTTPSRLHFGLLGWGPEAARQFGGVGLMVDDPGLKLSLEPSSRWAVDGPAAGRVLETVRAIRRELRARGHRTGPFRVAIERASDPHVGLGSGTQLGMALAHALAHFAGMPDVSVEELARLAGRGLRSGIGIHGFGRGGLVVDAGRGGRMDVPTHLLHLAFPEDWAVLLVLHDSGPGVHGGEEIEAFRHLPGMPERETERLCRLLLLGLLPAVIEHDLPAFGDALESIQEAVGSCFSAVQQGRYASPKSEAVVRVMRALGLVGVGQSSWGPCLYGFAKLSPEEKASVRHRLADHFQLPPGQVFWTQASRTGAEVTLD